MIFWCKLWKSGYISEAKEMIAICNCHYRFLNIRALEMILMRLTIYLENWESEGKIFRKGLLWKKQKKSGWLIECVLYYIIFDITRLKKVTEKFVNFKKLEQKWYIQLNVQILLEECRNLTLMHNFLDENCLRFYLKIRKYYRRNYFFL